MDKLDPKADGATLDVVAETVRKMQGLLPDAFCEGRVDFDALREMLGDFVDDRSEKYSFSWHGKSAARRIAQTPSTGTLRPCADQSVNWRDSKNLFIEGDNLEVLKLLQKSFYGRVKMIFIDPPYNTGGDFIYPDKYEDNLRTYLRYTGQTDEDGLRLSANAETAGRYHTNWLNMMYPRLKLARNLLAEDGVILISIDDCEVTNLRKICDEIFGEENFVATVVWQKKYARQNDAGWFSTSHDYVHVFARSKQSWTPGRVQKGDPERGYSNPDNDPRGPWQSVVCTCNKTKAERPNLYYAMTQPKTGEPVFPAETRVWGFDQARYRHLEADNRLWWGIDSSKEKPRLKVFLSELAQGMVPDTLWLRDDVGDNQDARREILALFDEVAFDTAKPTKLIRRMLEIATRPDKEDIVLDFFAGSASTADAVMRQNVDDGGDRRFIMVQLPEPIDHDAFETIADIGKERLRRVGAQLASEHGEADLGFRSFALAASNVRAWDPSSDDIEGSLLDAVDVLAAGRSSQDLLFELLLKYGLDLSVPIDIRDLDGQQVFVVANGALVAVLEGPITERVAEGVLRLKAELKPEVMRVVFRDADFATDVDKTNVSQILKKAGVDDVRSV